MDNGEKAEFYRIEEVNVDGMKTFEEELKKELVLKCLPLVRKFLLLAIKEAKNRDVSREVALAKKFSDKAKSILEEIVISEEELKQLLAMGYTSESGNWLQLAIERCGKQDVSREVALAKKFSDKAKSILEEIVISEEELKAELVSYRWL